MRPQCTAYISDIFYVYASVIKECICCVNMEMYMCAGMCVIYARVIQHCQLLYRFLVSFDSPGKNIFYVVCLCVVCDAL